MPPPPKAVRIKETGKVYLSARKAAEAIGGDFATIFACLRGERRSHMGYTFEYVESNG